jgi:hypothetical protein
MEEAGRRDAMAAEDLRASDPDEANGVAMMAGAVAVRDEDGNEVDESADEVGAGSDLKIAAEDGGHGESGEDVEGLCAGAGVDAGTGDGEQDVASVNGHLVHDDGVGESDWDGHESGSENDHGVAVRAPCRVVGLYLCHVQDTSCPCSFALVRAPIRVHDPGRQ